jgi:hypothetical protein
MMHDADDATLMQALRDADPLRGSTLDDRARHRLEQSWREAIAASAGSSARRRAIGARGRTLQPIAAAIMALVILTGGVIVSNIVTRRGEGPVPTTQQAGGVEGSYRAVWQSGDGPTDTFLVAGGRALIRPGDTVWDVYPARQWQGFGEASSMRFEQMLLDGDQMYLLIRANPEKPPRWYRYSGSRAPWPPGLAETPQPVFEEGTRGFERVDDEDAQAKGLTRYTADADAADLDFLGWFASTNRTPGPPATTVDIWVDADGRVRRLEEVRRADPDNPSITRFDRFDAVDPINLLYPEGADAPVAEDIAGMILYTYGDPAFADELHEHVVAELEGDADIREFAIWERSSADKRKDGPNLESELFVVVVRFNTYIAADVNALRTKVDRLASLSVGDVPADVSADPQGYAAIYTPTPVFWMRLGG